IPRYRVNTEYHGVAMRQEFSYGKGADALHRGAGMNEIENPHNVNEQKYRQCYKDLVHEVYDSVTLELKSKYRRRKAHPANQTSVSRSNAEGPSSGPCARETVDPVNSIIPSVQKIREVIAH